METPNHGDPTEDTEPPKAMEPPTLEAPPPPHSSPPNLGSGDAPGMGEHSGNITGRGGQGGKGGGVEEEGEEFGVAPPEMGVPEKSGVGAQRDGAPRGGRLFG